MRSIKDYSVARLVIVAFGVGVIVGVLRIVVMAVFQIGSSSVWSPFVTGAVAGIVVVATLAYFSTGGRNRQLLRRENHAGGRQRKGT
jgi:phosphate/sulfate permease